jgi:hypothetical protein
MAGSWSSLPNETVIEGRTYGLTRLCSLLALCAMAAGLFYVGRALYQAYRDSFVAPIVLSPDSELVISSRLSLSRLITDKSALETRVREAAAIIQAGDIATQKLKVLKELVAQSLKWSTWVNGQERSSSTTDLEALAAQKQLLQQHIAEQSAYVDEMERNLANGMVRKTDVLREQSELSQLRIAALENERERVVSRARLKQTAAAKRALASAGDKGVQTPEMIQQRDQLVRIELELLKFEADKRTREDELRAAVEELSRTEQLISQLKQRPVFRAIEAEQNVAFVPYSQLSGVRAGAAVYACSVWSVFGCKDVGRVLEVLKGEVNTQDPWGATVRGQYALLDLSDSSAGRSKLLRVRPEASSATAAFRRLAAMFGRQP